MNLLIWLTASCAALVLLFVGLRSCFRKKWERQLEDKQQELDRENLKKYMK